MTDKECSNCGAWMEQTSGYIQGGVSHGTSWRCPNCSRIEDEGDDDSTTTKGEEVTDVQDLIEEIHMEANRAGFGADKFPAFPVYAQTQQDEWEVVGCEFNMDVESPNGPCLYINLGVKLSG